MTARSRKPDSKVAAPVLTTATQKRDLFEALGLGRMQSWLIGGVAALTAATLILNGDGLTREGDNILIALLWSLLATVLLIVRAKQPLEDRSRCRWFDVVATVFFGWVLVSFAVVWCSGNGSPRNMLTMLTHWGGFAAMYVTWRLLLRDQLMIRAMLLLFVALIIAETAAAYYHYYHLGPQTRREYNDALEQGTVASPDSQTPGELELMKNRVDSIEPLGTYSLTNSLAAVLMPWCVFLCGMMMLGRMQSRFRLGQIAVVVLMIAFVGFILLMTNSRSGILATLFGIVCLFGYMIVAKVRNKRVLLGAAIVACGAIAAGLGIGFATGGLNATMLTLATKSFGYRIQYWQSSSQMIADNPLVGCGIGNFREYYTQYKLPTASETIADPHNLFFEVATNAGLPALACFVVLLVAAIGYAFTSKTEETPYEPKGIRESWRQYQPICYGGIVGIITAFVYSFTNYVPLSFDLALFALVGFVLGFFLSMPAIDSTGVPLKALVPICLVVLTVDLLTSGGIAFPHVNVTFWFLMVVCFRGQEEVPNANSEARSPKSEVCAALCFLALTIVLYPTAWLANLRANVILRNMEDNPSQFMFIDKRIAEWEKAVKEDTYRTRVWCDLCAAYLTEQREFPDLAKRQSDTSGWQALVEKRMQQAGIERDLSRVTLNGTTADALAHAIQSSPLSASNYQSLGLLFLDDFEKTKNSGSLDLAIALFELAAVRYPNHSLSFAYLAICYRQSGEQELQHQNARLAVELDDITPHSDQKLPPELRQAVEQLNKKGSSGNFVPRMEGIVKSGQVVLLE